jgi:hypothetical protein
LRGIFFYICEHSELTILQFWVSILHLKLSTCDDIGSRRYADNSTGQYFVKIVSHILNWFFNYLTNSLKFISPSVPTPQKNDGALPPIRL